MARKKGILYVRMTNPDADCSAIGLNGRKENIVTVGWKTRTDATTVIDDICERYSASIALMPTNISENYPRPTKFKGRLKQMEVVYPHGSTATPLTSYDVKLVLPVEASHNAVTIMDLAASAFLDIPIKQASRKSSQIKTWNPPLEIDSDLRIRVCNTAATATHYHAGAIKLYFE